MCVAIKSHNCRNQSVFGRGKVCAHTEKNELIKLFGFGNWFRSWRRRWRRAHHFVPLFTDGYRCANKIWVFFSSFCLCECVFLFAFHWMDSIYNWMLSSLTIILRVALWPLFCCCIKWLLLVSVYFISRFFVLFFPCCFILFFVSFLSGFTHAFFYVIALSISVVQSTVFFPVCDFLFCESAFPTWFFFPQL